MFELNFKKSADKALAALPLATQERIAERLQSVLLINPFPASGNPKKLHGRADYSFPVSDYRVLYTINENLITIFAIGHRREIYRK